MSTRAEGSARPGSVEFWAEHKPDERALCESARALSWRAWNDAANRIAEVLSSLGNVGPDDRVAVCTQNRLEWFVSQAAIAKLGALLVPVSHRLTPAEIHYIVADCQARAFIFDAEDVDAMARVWTDQPRSDVPSAVAVAISVMRSHRVDVLSFAEVSQKGPIVTRVAKASPRSIVYTSGTTGRPRGVIIGRERSARTREPAQQQPEQQRAEEQPPKPMPVQAARATGLERNLLGAPLNHAAGQASARATLAGGGCVYIMPRFDAEEALRVIASEKITMTFLVPTMLNRIVNLPKQVLAAYDVSSIRIITTGASPCPQPLKEKVIAYFGNHCLHESYGSTEVGLVSRMLPEDHLRKPGSCGRLLDSVSVRLVDADGREVPQGSLGEIYVRTPLMITRYLNQGIPGELVEGYFATGDVGRFDEEGFLYILDRKKDMIIAGGVNIYPAEIESALREHPDVLDAAVFGIPHAEWGEEVKAVVECIDGHTLGAEELLLFVSDKLAGYKCPRSIDFVSEIPRNAAGKPLKAAMRAPYWQATGKAI
jgi:long-chain acyl-CoA synthetase